MKKTVISIIGIAFMLFAFTACQPRYIYIPVPGFGNDNTPHVHEFGEWTTIIEPTCTTEGERMRVCEGCSATETETIDALGHDFNGTNTCIRCGTVGQVVSTGDDFSTALQKEDENIIIILQNDTSINVGSSVVLGTEKTKSIEIEGNNHKITFDSTWDYIVKTKNADAVLTIKNATIDNSGANADSGTWNIHDIVFDCEVILDNVTVNNAVAVGKNATIKNSKISEADYASDAYMLWIQANGQTVTVEDCEIDGRGSAGYKNRAIKIADEYITNPGHIILNVSGTKFYSDKKAAVLVTNTAGATINWGEGNDISGVAADTENAVWNDEARKENMNLIHVYGCTIAQEGE